MAQIPLTKGRVALVDDSDCGLLACWRWCVGNRYAQSRIKGKLVYMHRFIMQAPDGVSVDHINGNTLDNRRVNLRLATHRENMRNQKFREGRRYKGVYWRKDTQKWQVKIMVDGKSINLGCYSDEEMAAVAYDVAARIYFGEFARTNFDWGTNQ